MCSSVPQTHQFLICLLLGPVIILRGIFSSHGQFNTLKTICYSLLLIIALRSTLYPAAVYIFVSLKENSSTYGTVSGNETNGMYRTYPRGGGFLLKFWSLLYLYLTFFQWGFTAVLRNLPEPPPPPLAFAVSSASELYLRENKKWKKNPDVPCNAAFS